MDFSFVIPNSNAALLNTEGDKYYVKQVFDKNEIPDKLTQCKSAAFSGDPFYIFDHFDTYFSVIENSKNLSKIYIIRAYDLLYLTIDKLGQQLALVLSKPDGLSGKNRNSFLNLTKMTIYLIIGVVKCLDKIVQQAQSAQIKKTKKTNVDAFDGLDWDQKRYKFLIELYNLFQLPLEKLWDPPIAEEDFVNLICDINYRTLEIYCDKERHVSQTVFQILGTAIKRFNHALTFPVRILQILRICEEASLPIANGILLLHEEFGITSISSILIKDIVDSLSVDSADTQISKNFSRFLTEFGTTAPKLIIPHLSTLGDELLNCESHVIRNCVLQIMGDVITCELTSEELSDDLKEIRDEFLENLLLHINDVSAHVRSKVLQIWNHMKEENAVPLAFQHKVLRGGVERLEDKTSTVRKAAVTLIKSFLERNPFSAKLTLAELIKRYETELEKLDKLKDVLAEENNKIADCEKHWEEVIPTLLPIIEDVLSKSTCISSSQENYEEMVKKISSLLIEKKYREAVVLARQADHLVGNSDWLALKFEEQCVYYLALLKSYILLNSGINNKINEEYEIQFQAVKFLEDSIEFSKIITEAVPKIQEMLLSKTNSDVFEAVDFFTTGYLFGIKGTEGGMRRMLYLVCSSDKEKRDAVSNAYKKVLFTTDQTGRLHSIKVVKNLCSLFEDLTYGHYTALEGLVKDWVDNNDIDLNIIQVLFERFTLKIEGTTENESRQALQLLILASNAKSTITTANISIIETIGFGERAMKDPRIFTGCLSFLFNSVPIESRSKYYKRYDEDHILVQKVLNCFKKYFFHPRINDFDDVATKTIEFCYTLCQSPDVICQKLIIDIHKKIKSFIGKIQGIEITEKKIPESQLFTQDDNENNIITTTQATNSQIPHSQQQSQNTTIILPVFLISRFIFLIGFTTMKELIFLDIDVYNNLKYRQDLKEEINNLKKKKDNAMRCKTNNNKRKTNLDTSASESLKRLSGTAAEPQQEPDEELVGATAEDTIAELINHICENELLYSHNGIINKMVSIIIEICKNPGKYQNDELQQASSLALLRFMTVSSKFCEKNMPFLMNILNKTKNIKIKCNIVIGLSDLTFRFPNVIEPWTSHFYLTLHDSNDELRLTAVKMLSHLILHEMIRVKGQIAELAMCIVDKNDEIKNITQQFFKEIANKSNILYNVLPDIISKLSDTSLNLLEEKYRIIMRYILGLIQKDRQVESLVEKLCLRFRVTIEERQWRDIAFCLSLLNYTEKTIKKLTYHIQYFKDKVQVDEVYQSFKTIISNTSKLAKVETKQALTEFELRLSECFEINDENADILSGGENIKRLPSVRTKSNKKQSSKKGVGRGGSQRKNREQSSTESENSISDSNSDSDDQFQETNKNKSNEAGNKQTKNKPKVVAIQKPRNKTGIIEDSTSSEEEMPQRKRGRNRI